MEKRFRLSEGLKVDEKETRETPPNPVGSKRGTEKSSSVYPKY